MKKFLSVLLVAVMLFGVIGTVAFVQGSSDVITASDAGGGDLTAQDIWIIIAILAGIGLLILIL